MSSPIRLTLLSHLQDVCDNATVAMFVMDERQCCVYMNPAAEMLTGYQLEEVQGAPLHNFVHHTRPDGTHYPLEECPIDQAAPANMQEQGEEIFVHRDGSFYPVYFTASPVRREGKVVGTVIEVQDARPRKQQEREREALHSIGSLILQELSHEKIVEAVTEAATGLIGAQFGAFFYNVQDEAGESYTLYTIAGVPKENFSQFPLPRATHLFGPTFRGEGAIRSGDIRADPRYGKMAPHHGMPPGHLPVRSYLAVPVSLGGGEVIGGLFFGHEDTDRFTESHERLVETLAAQAAIGLNKASLYQEALFARRRAELDAFEKQKLYEEAARANEAKDQFLATVSHELRTPLTSILGWAQMLTSGKLDDTMRQRAINTIERNARSQAQIVEDLLDISRIVNGKLRLNVQLFSPQMSVDAALESLRPAAQAKNITLQLVLDPSAGPISGDPERLQQIVWNLLSNAVKFTPKGGRVYLTLKKIDSNVQIIVGDNGAGIPAEHLPAIFDTFTQVDPSSTRQQGGLGLGLAIVKKLVELHGGYVQASSPGVGKGSVFTVTLPLAAVKESGAAPEAGAAAAANFTLPQDTEEFGLRGATILLVEDDDDARSMLASVLLSAHAVVETASNASEALTLFDGIHPDLVVSDIGMPGMDGYEFIAELRRREREAGQPGVPAVALTAYARVQDRMRALTAGFQMHVAKPVEPAELLTVLSSLRSWNIPQ
ncbi:ATP-binding protein [Massilia sp. H6]|uniref:hybrid sensor histidine kinase/response regulator n=1 Tax=Massilia sp. H6 TaxID=2970464 RepID=UPI002166F5C7|nr:ATP-binding protein [Massilia sp. H6]UVW29804.1 ATP-binding protein [Massilia sp. H6]